ncbi:hypothetical protein WN944_006016 [Citrus x changshan-huyou]|uniref:Pectinesterase inhibitor domain-containing protein n=1 Tax=Citrus x changshan-huyou TaxID=2935761 RepID=A0AAP0MPS2_9ROSI
MENIKAASMVMFIVIMLCFSSNRPGVEGVRGEENDLIEAICKKTSYPDVCIKTLRSSPGSSGADVKVYDLTIHDIPKAIKYLESGDYDSATEYANDGIIDSDTCESSFKEFPEIPKSPLTDRNNGLTELCVIALDMIDLLK